MKTLIIAVMFALGPGPEELYKKHCQICHGLSGDGIASTSMNPKPTRFTDTEWAASTTMREVTEIIFFHQRDMPPFAKFLTFEEVEALAWYVLGLSRKKNDE